MPRITFDSVHFHYDDPYRLVFQGLDLTLDTRWRCGLVGRNGRGKTTLLGLVSGRLEPFRGRLSRTLPIRTFPYQPALPPDRPVREVIRESVAPFSEWERRMEELLAGGSDRDLEEYGELQARYQRQGGYEMEARIEREIHRIGLDPALLDRPFQTLSGGEQTRALILPLFLEPGVFALLDEPTNHLDAEGRERLGRYLAAQPGFLLASHDRYLLDLCTDHIASLNRGDVRVNQGSYSGWKAEMDLQEASEMRREANLQREIRSLKRAARQRRTWSDRKERTKKGAGDSGRVGHLAARQMKRALVIERRSRDRLAEKQSLLRNQEKERRARIPTSESGPETLLRIHRLRVDRGGRPILIDLDLTVHRGERIALQGPNGCGKTTLLAAIAGELSPAGGTLHRPAHVRLARSHQIPRWQTGLLRDHLEEAGVDQARYRTLLGVLDVTGEIFERPLETFSQGERKKVDLCLTLMEPSHLYLWDEPLNYLDTMTRHRLEETVLASEPTMIFVEHDRYFVEAVATRVVELV